jgi:hypothetical protein
MFDIIQQSAMFFKKKKKTLRHNISSDPSKQSLYPSHLFAKGKQRPSGHRNDVSLEQTPSSVM